LAWCRAHGFAGVTAFKKAEDVPPTILLGAGEVCDQPSCDGFASITCLRPDTVEFSNPFHGSYALDWCLGASVDCGQPAADAWCIARGFVRAQSFRQLPNVPPTRVFSTGAICNEPSCDSFQSITCSRR
jgi:hypothetical protein